MGRADLLGQRSESVRPERERFKCVSEGMKFAYLKLYSLDPLGN